MKSDLFALGVGRLRRLWGELGVAAIPIVLGTATILLGLVAWTDYALHDCNYVASRQAEKNFNSPFHAVAFVLFRTLGAFFPSVWNINEGTFWTDVTAVLGLATFYCSVVIIAADRFAGTLRQLAARFLYRGHVIIIGGTALARRAAMLWSRGRTVVHLIDPIDPPPPRLEGRRWVKTALDGTIVERFGVARSAHVFIDLGEDMATLALALELLPGACPHGRKRAAGSGETDDWTVVVNDKRLADQFAKRLEAMQVRGDEVPRINYFSPQRAVVRDILAEHPLFLDGCATRRGAIHAVIFGFGSSGRHLVEMIFLTSLLADQPRTRVTILSGQRVADRAAFLVGRPTLADLLDVEFLDMSALDDFEAASGNPARRLRAREAETPSTAIFLMSDSFNENVRLAVKVNHIQRKTGRLSGRLFALESSHEPGSACKMSQAFAKTIDGFLPFGLKDERLKTQICDPDRRDKLARELHANYLKTTDSHEAWGKLAESYRRANCNGADHALAKLHMLGFDVSRVPAGVIPKLREEDVRDIRAALDATTSGTSGPLHGIIRLEHERWFIERRLDGWTFGEIKDTNRQTHPLLVDWDELCAHHPKEQLKDKAQIEALINCLVKDGEGSPLKRDPAVLGTPRPIG